jgi:hypothetical protein
LLLDKLFRPSTCYSRTFPASAISSVIPCPVPVIPKQSTMDGGGGGGYYKYRCKNWLTYNCESWVWVNGAVCANCLVRNGVGLANKMIKYVVQAQGREAETPGRSIITQELRVSRLDSPPNYTCFEIVSIDYGHEAMWREKDKP